VRVSSKCVLRDGITCQRVASDKTRSQMAKISTDFFALIGLSIDLSARRKRLQVRQSCSAS
jgi:hypothetical protein